MISLRFADPRRRMPGVEGCDSSTMYLSLRRSVRYRAFVRRSYGGEVDFRHLFEEGDGGRLFKAGATVFTEGTPGRFMYVVFDGEVDVRKDGLTLYTVRGGSLVGEMALIDHRPRSATAIARIDCRLIAVDEYKFLVMVQQTPLFALEVMRLLVERLRQMNDHFSA